MFYRASFLRNDVLVVVADAEDDLAFVLDSGNQYAADHDIAVSFEESPDNESWEVVP